MPLRSKPRPQGDPDPVYYSGTCLRQKRFPMRRKTIKAIPESTPTSTERQQTMTQAGYVSTLPPLSKRKRGEHEEVGDSESELELDEQGSSDQTRQQTLTQMMHGVQPTPGYENDWRIPALKRRRGRMAAEEKRQQTLTQMVHGVTPIPVVSDDDDEEDDDNGYALAIEQHLAGHGIYRPAHEAKPPKSPVHQHPGGLQHLHKWMTDQETRAHQVPSNHVAPLCSPIKVKTENPKTPPRQSLLEVPSSQSPPESPLSTQKSTEHQSRYPLQERSSNPRGLLESPSKGRNVAIRNPAIRKSVSQTNKVVKEERTESSPAPLHRIFQNTIQDTDEEEELQSEDEDIMTRNHDTREKTQVLTNQIDMACASPRPISNLIKNIEDEVPIVENNLSQPVDARRISVSVDRTNNEPVYQQERSQPLHIHFKAPQAMKPESQSAQKSQDTTGTGTERAAAQLQSDLESYNHRQTIRQSPSVKRPPLEQHNQRIQDSNPFPTQSSHTSQATTVDCTQLSPCNTYHSVQQPPVSPSMPPPLTIPSSLPSIMSSPSVSRVNTSAESPYLRTGAGIVTASQMVPESLDDYSIPPLPPWNDDDDDDDDDEEL